MKGGSHACEYQTSNVSNLCSRSRVTGGSTQLRVTRLVRPTTPPPPFLVMSDDDSYQFDDDLICAAPATFESRFESYPSSATTLGKRKSESHDDLELFTTAATSAYKRRLSDDDGPSPYIIVSFIRGFRAPLQ